MLRPNLTAQLHRKSATRDLFGKQSWMAPIPVRCGVVKLESLTQPTSVRADSSASRGSADDLVADARVLLPPTTVARIGDVLELDAIFVEIDGLHPRRNTRVVLDHYEVRGKIRAEL